MCLHRGEAVQREGTAQAKSGIQESIENRNNYSRGLENVVKKW